MPVRLLSFVLTVALLVSAGASRTVLHFCGALGQITAKCCCKSVDDSAGPEPALRMDCCDEQSAGGEPAAFTLGPLFQLLATSSGYDIEIRPAFAIVPDELRARPPAARGPPRRAALFLDHCSLLI